MAAMRNSRPMLETVHARVSLQERQLFEKAARKRGQTLADFMREAMTHRALIDLDAA
jgi:uncharacterized protein (DUF1778 family)